MNKTRCIGRKFAQAVGVISWLKKNPSETLTLTSNEDFNSLLSYLKEINSCAPSFAQLNENDWNRLIINGQGVLL